MNNFSEPDSDHRLDDWSAGEPPVEELTEEEQSPDDVGDDEALIERFRVWLREARAEAEELTADEESGESERNELDVQEDDESSMATSL